MVADEANLSLDLLVASIPNPQRNLKFYAVGYGSIERAGPKCAECATRDLCEFRGKTKTPVPLSPLRN